MRGAGAVAWATRESDLLSARSRWPSSRASPVRRCRAPSPTARASPRRRGARCCRRRSELGYHVNHLARSLIQEQSGIVCLIVAESPRPIQSRMLDALTPAPAGDRPGRRWSSTPPARASSVEDGAAPDAELSRGRDDRPVRARPPAALITTCLNSGQRVILINRDDHVDGPVQRIRRQCGAPRARRCTCSTAADAAGSRWSPRRRARRASSRASAPSPRPRRTLGLERRVVRAGPTGYAAGFEAGRDPAQRLDAARCGLLRHRPARLRLHGRRARTSSACTIPADLCVVGFDDIEQAGWASYNLTTFRQPIDAIADHIMTLIADKGRTWPPARRRFHAAPVWRRSVRPS